MPFWPPTLNCVLTYTNATTSPKTPYFPKKIEVKHNLIIRISPDAIKTLLANKRLYIQYLVFRIEDRVCTLRCFNCQRFGHQSKSCKSKTQVCGHCSKTQLACDCPSNNKPDFFKCSNYSGTHHTGYRSCPAALRATIRQAALTNYAYYTTNHFPMQPRQLLTPQLRFLPPSHFSSPRLRPFNSHITTTTSLLVSPLIIPCHSKHFRTPISVSAK